MQGVVAFLETPVPLWLLLCVVTASAAAMVLMTKWSDEMYREALRYAGEANRLERELKSKT
jgi:hypothetical protein